jgi:hypothetical protein
MQEDSGILKPQTAALHLSMREPMSLAGIAKMRNASMSEHC